MKAQWRRQERSCGNWAVKFNYPDTGDEIRLVVSEEPDALSYRAAEGRLESLAAYGYTEMRGITNYNYEGYEYTHIPRDRSRVYMAGCVLYTDEVCIDLSCRSFHCKPPLFKHVTIFRINRKGIFDDR